MLLFIVKSWVLFGYADQSNTGGKSHHAAVAIGASFGAALLTICVIGLGIWWCYGRKRQIFFDVNGLSLVSSFNFSPWITSDFLSLFRAKKSNFRYCIIVYFCTVLEWKFVMAPKNRDPFVDILNIKLKNEAHIILGHL